MSLNDLFSDAPPAKQTTTSTTDPFADAPDMPKAPPKFSGAITGQGTKPSPSVSGTAPFQLSPQDLAGLMPGGAPAMPGIVAAETLVIVRDRVRSNARKRFGNRYSESHYELMGDYAAATGASNRAIMNLAAKGDFDTMRKALNTQPESLFGWARGQMERVAQEATGQSLGSVLGDAARGGQSFDLVSAALDPNSYSRQVAESIPAVPPAPVKRPDVLAAIKWQEESMRRDPATGMIAYTPRAMAQIRQKQRSDWMKRHGYDPSKEPIRYLSDLATETGEDLKSFASRIVGPVDDFLTHGLRGEPTGRPMIVPEGAPWKERPGPLAESIGGFLALPYDVAADTAILVHPKARMLDRAGAAVNLYLKAGAPGTARALNNIRQGGPWKIAEIERVFLKDGFTKPEAKEAARAVNGIYDFFMRHSETPPGFWDGLRKVTQERKLNIARNMSEWLQNRGTPVTPEPVVPALPKPVAGQTGPERSPEPPTNPVAPPTTIQPSRPLVSAEGYSFTETRISPTTLGVYPGLQYKRVGITDAENAVTDDLKAVERYDQATAGPLTVWMTNDARLWVMNGHHRRELAIRTKEPDVSVRIFRESDGVDFQTARALGALQNIRDGKGTALDAATVLRDLGASAEKLRSYGLNTRGGIARDAQSLLKLSDASLTLVEDGQVPEVVAASIADAGLDSKRELAVMKLAAQGGIETRSQAAILAERARNAPLVDRSGGMGDLFGEFDEDLALAEQAKIADAALRRLAQSQRALNAFTRAKAVGNTTIDEEAQNAAAAVQEFGRKVIATDPETARILETEAVKYAGNPTKKQLEQSIAAVVASAERAAERRLAELGATEGSGLGSSDENGIRVGDGAPEPAAQRGIARSFTTAKGSTYEIHDDGTTTRTKAPRPEHPGDAGLQPRSEATFYVTPDQANALSIFQARGSKKQLVRLEGDDWGIKYLSGPSKGKIERSSLVTPVTEPAIGLLPVEVFGGGLRVHFGNKITDLGTAPPSKQTSSEKPVKPLGRGAWSATATDEEKQRVLATLTDSYKGDNPRQREAEIIEKLLPSGRTIEVYGPYQTSYMPISDYTGKPVRHYVRLPDGTIAHVSEVFPDISAKALDELEAAKNLDVDPGAKLGKRTVREAFDSWKGSSRLSYFELTRWKHPARKDFRETGMRTPPAFVRMLASEGWTVHKHAEPRTWQKFANGKIDIPPTWDFLVQNPAWAEEILALDSEKGGIVLGDAARRRLEVFVRLEARAPMRGKGSSHEAPSGDRLFDDEPVLVLTPEPATAKPVVEAKPDTNPVGPQLTLSPEEIGDTKGQFGLSLDRRMRGRRPNRRRYLAQKNLEGTGLPDKPKEAYTRDEFKARIDQISKIARGGGSNVFEDLRRQNALGVFEFPTRKFRLGRIRYRNGLPSRVLAETLAHEVGHQIDFIVSNAVAGAKKPTGKISTLFNARGLAAETISGELIKVTRILEGEKAVADDPDYFLDPRELYARFLQSVMFHPHIVEEHAPVAFAAFAKMAEKHPIIADYLNIAKGGVIERPQAFFFFPDVRQGYIRKLDRYLGTKAYGEEVLYRARRAKAIQDAEDLINAKFREITDSPEKLFDAAEGVKITVGGVPEFGTRIYRSITVPDDADLELILDGLTTDDAKIQKFADEVGVLVADGFKFVGVSKDGNAMFEKWRKTPGEAELAYNALSDAGKALIREYTADLAEATDIFNRNLAAETFKIEGDLEGYVHHFGFAGNSPNVWSKLFLKERTATQRKHRSEAKGFKKDLKLAVAKTLTELSIEKVWNEFVVRQVALVAEPLRDGEKYANKPGWTAIEGDLLHGLKLIGQDKTVLLKEDGTSFLLKRGKRYQIPNELYERYVKSGPFGEELSRSVQIMNAVNRYWQANILVDAGSAATNLISGGLQFTAKVLDDFYKDILYRDGKFDRTLANMAGFFHTMTPSGWKAAPDWAFGGNQSLLYHQFFGQRGSVNAVDRVYDKLLTPYQAIERFWKKVILNTELRKAGGHEALDDAEFIKAVNDVIDLYAYDYQNIPLWLETMKRNPVGAGVKPFLTYPYKYAKMLSNMAGGAFDTNLPTKDRIAKLLALGTILTAYALYKRGREKEKTVGVLGPDEPATYDEAKLKSVVNPRGRLFLGKDSSGKEVFVRTAKYPFLNVYDTISALVEGDVREASEIVRDQVGTLGPVGKLALNNVFGYRGEFDTYKSVSTMNAETGASFFPLNRPLKSFSEILDPKKRNLPKTPGQVFGQLIPTTSEGWRRRLAGDEATVRVPLRKDELDLIRAKQQDKAIALVTDRLGQDAGKALREYLVSREGKRATGRVGGMRETIDLPVPQNTADEIFKALGGVILKRVDREWYDRFKARAIENARNRDKKDFESSKESL